MDTPGQSGVLINDLPEYPPMALISKGFQNFEDGKIPTFMDSGASDMMFVLREAFDNYTPTDGRMGDSAKATEGSFEIIGEGNVTQRYAIEGKEREVTYTRALHTPTLNTNLVSVSSLDRAGLTITFGNGQGIARKANGTVVMAGKGVNGMYLLETLDGKSNKPVAMTSLSQPTSLGQWHRRLAHCSPSTIKEMEKANLVDGLKISEANLTGKCEDCIMGRQTRRPFNGETAKDLNPLELVSFDLWGPSLTQSVGGKVYLMIIVDAGMSYKYGAYLADKSDSTTLAAFETFQAHAESLSGKKIRRLHTDGAFETTTWKDYCQRNSITQELTAPYSSSQNGLSERAIRTTIDDVHTLLRDSGLSHTYWAEAAAHSIYTRNLIPSRRYPGRIPMELFSGKRQSISHLCVFGVKCWAKVPTVHGAQITGGSKLDPRSVPCRFLGYAAGAGNYRVQDVTTRRVYVSRDVVFEEGQPRRTLASVGEQIPLFDTIVDTPLTNNAHDTTDPAITDNPTITDDQQLEVRNDQPNIPAITEPCRSTRAPNPSKAGTQSREYQQREVLGRTEGQEWATNQPRASPAIDWSSSTVDDSNFLACLTDMKASQFIPRSY